MNKISKINNTNIVDTALNASNTSETINESSNIIVQSNSSYFKNPISSLFNYIKNKIISSINTANDSLRNALNSWLQGSTLSTVDTTNKLPINSSALTTQLNDALTLSTNLNEEMTLCYFNINTNNRPFNYGNYGICRTSYGYNKKWIWQYAYLTNGNTAMRFKMLDSENTWSNWQKLVKDSDLDSLVKIKTFTNQTPADSHNFFYTLGDISTKNIINIKAGSNITFRLYQLGNDWRVRFFDYQNETLAINTVTNFTVYYLD